MIVDARSHTCISHDFIPRYDINMRTGVTLMNNTVLAFLLLNLQHISHQVEKIISQVDGSDVTGKSENISHNSHNSKLTENAFDIQHESHNSLKLETSNMDKFIPVKMSI